MTVTGRTAAQQRPDAGQQFGVGHLVLQPLAGVLPGDQEGTDHSHDGDLAPRAARCASVPLYASLTRSYARKNAAISGSTLPNRADKKFPTAPVMANHRRTRRSPAS